MLNDIKDRYIAYKQL